MSDHVVQQLRSALAGALTGLTTTGARVHQSRGAVVRLKATELPALYVGMPRESLESLTVHYPMHQQRTVEVPIVALAKDDDDVEAVLLQVQNEVEVKLGSAAPATLLSIGVRSLELTDTDPQLDVGLEIPAGQLALNWRAELFTVAGVPGTFA